MLKQYYTELSWIKILNEDQPDSASLNISQHRQTKSGVKQTQQISTRYSGLMGPFMIEILSIDHSI